MEFNETKELIEDIAEGKMVILLDDEDRENEGDLVCAAELIDDKKINFMISKARGLVCLPLSPEKCDKLNLPMMTNNNRAKHGTGFTVSIEAKEGITTGISAVDRALTIQAAANKDAVASDIVQPGHIFPLRASEGGVLSRAGHTEAACDLSRLAGLEEAGVICEIMNEDGTMARRDDLLEFAKKYEMKIGTISDLIQYRALKEKSVKFEYSKNVEIQGISFELSAWTDTIFNNLHLAFVKGDIASSDVPLVRVHVPNTLHDLVGLEEFGERLDIRKALARIGQEPCAVLILIGNNQDPEGIINNLKGTQTTIVPETKTVGIGSQILRELGLKKIKLLAAPVKYPSLGGFDLEIIGFEQ